MDDTQDYATITGGLDTTLMPTSPSSEEELLDTTPGLNDLTLNDQTEEPSLGSQDESNNGSFFWDTPAELPDLDHGLPTATLPAHSLLNTLSPPPSQGHSQSVNLGSRPSSSQATTPDPTQNTVLHFSPDPLTTQASLRVEEEDVQSPPSPLAQIHPITAITEDEDFCTASPNESDTDAVYEPLAPSPRRPNTPVSPFTPDVVPTNTACTTNSVSGSSPRAGQGLSHNIRESHGTRSPGDASDKASPTQDTVSDLATQAQAESEVSPQNTSSLENFFDVLEEELLFRQEGESRKTDVLIYQNHELTRDRLADRQCHTQYWHCRHRRKHKCKARLTLRVKNLDDITQESTIHNYTPHCHSPYRMKSYGTVERSILQPTDGSMGNHDEGTDQSNHAISQLSEGDFERDFDRDNLTSKACSSPAMTKQRVLRPSEDDDSNQDLPKGTSSMEITNIAIDTSELDARGYPISKYLTCARKYKDHYLNHYLGQHDPDDDSSD